MMRANAEFLVFPLQSYVCMPPHIHGLLGHLLNVTGSFAAIVPVERFQGTLSTPSRPYQKNPNGSMETSCVFKLYQIMKTIQKITNAKDEGMTSSTEMSFLRDGFLVQQEQKKWDCVMHSIGIK